MTLVKIETTMGDMTVELFDQRSPITVRNFLGYVNAGFYNGLIFHRVIPNFMIQGGGFTPQMIEKPPLFPPIQNEARISGIRNTRGTIAMARTSDPNSATCQFFINVADNHFLDPSPQNPHGYAAFGMVREGMAVADAISKVPTTRVGIHENVPIQPVIIKRIYVIG